ncbi:type I secretion system permease/ATPase [Nitratireductor sp. GISD-1A_MAKvit]|uniref:type I secretion system permease/ATPase n=1 Tax=Nitratireductor sp. GISD-1A_MAKvit TaxID=3234198 RepID=UPI00346696CA
MVNEIAAEARLSVKIRRAMIDIGVFSLVANLLLLTMPLYLLQVYDRVLPSASMETLIYLSLIAIGALGFLGLFEFFRSLFALRVATVLDRQLGAKLFASLLEPGRMSPGDIQPLRDLATVRGFIGSKGLTTLFDLPFAPLFLMLLFLVHPALFWLTLGGAIVLLLLVGANQAATARSARETASLSAAANFTAQSFARNADSVRALGMHSNAVEHWGGLFAKSLHIQTRSAMLHTGFGTFSRTVRMLLQLSILGVGAILVLHGEMTAGMIFAASIISGRALQPLDQLIGGWRQTADAHTAWRRLNATIQFTAHVSRRTKLPEPRGALSVQDLSYLAPGARPGSKPVLSGLSFCIPAGESVALIGPSRAGKTSLARLLVGAAIPTCGTIRIDGADIQTWDAEQLGRHIGYLGQDVQLFPGSIAQNISRFSITPDDAGVVAAAKRAHAHELILSQTDGYQTPLGTSETMLSGGERQRIGLARAFYGSPRILILDEPNANLDSDGEVALGRALEEAKQADTTVIIITHRMPIAARCDRVMVLRQGVIEAFGPASEVLRGLVKDTNTSGGTVKTTSRPAPSFANGISAHYRAAMRKPEGPEQT